MAVNGQAIEDEDGLMLRIGRLPPTAAVKIEALRGGQKMQLNVTLAKYPVLGKQIFTPGPGLAGGARGLRQRAHYGPLCLSVWARPV